MSIPQSKMDFWIAHGLNVLFTGEAGVGKTAQVNQAFHRAKLNFKYYSASSIDPWVDLIGVPEKVLGVDGKYYLDLVRPAEWANDEVDAVFFDELNRAPKKVRNAVMELIQFKSINGKKFPRLKMVWAACNPDNSSMLGEYDVEPLDPAMKDRFHVQWDIPYAPDMAFFQGKFGQEMAAKALGWWRGLNDEQKKLVTPRRLDYALDIHTLGGDMRDILHKSTNPASLQSVLPNTAVQTMLKKFIASADSAAATAYLADMNNYRMALPMITASTPMVDFFAPLFPKDEIASLIDGDANWLKRFSRLATRHPAVAGVINSILTDGRNSRVVAGLKAAKSVVSSPLKGRVRVRQPEWQIPASVAIPTAAPLDVVSFAKVMDNLETLGTRDNNSRERAFEAIKRNRFWKGIPASDCWRALEMLDTVITRCKSPARARYIVGGDFVNVANCFIRILVQDHNVWPEQVVSRVTHLVKILIGEDNFYFTIR